MSKSKQAERFVRNDPAVRSEGRVVLGTAPQEQSVES